jgi:hypothetical protein
MSATRLQLIAMKDAGVAISCVHIDRKYVVFANGIKKKIRLFNEDDEPVKDPEDAAYYEFGDEEFGFGSAKVDLDDYQEWDQ